MHLPSIVPFKIKVADFLQKSAEAITQPLAILATLATLATWEAILDGYRVVVHTSVIE